MITISLCLIVKNEENSLGRCLGSVHDLVDEIVIVDTGSTDRTKEIAASFNARLFDFEWIHNFAAARNYAFDQATMEYIFWLDADDVLEEKDRVLLRELKATPDFDYDSVTMHYHLSFDASGKVTSSLRRNRLVKRSCGFRWHGIVHEYLAVGGRIMDSAIAVTHRKDVPHTSRNLDIYRNQQKAGVPFSPRDQYYFANELRDHGHYAEAAGMYERFLSGKQGWVEDNINGCYKLADCYAHLEEKEKQLASLLRALTYDKPRAELCCKLGDWFQQAGNWEVAIHWYQTATMLKLPENSWGAIDHAAWTWLPHLQLCVCYDRLGKRDKAYLHHELCKMHVPDHPSVKFNEAYFQKLGYPHQGGA
ncbi:glycosyltransferase [Paenibacillus thalictri]|uniref:Glycosyltransferase n=1 Tax=Paenibacillus thalictri TaxID=2527873 RepID=A0A4Q9DWB4_9BACL|nr:glycosyltransferase [Paenibacillus thalictri]TBL80625.1 glycosyltransferase [Paenibacillus thalictri]